MHEILFVLGLLVLIGAYTSVGLVPWYAMIAFGRSLMLSAAAFGIPLELMYFALLALALHRSGTVPRGWYWRSFAHHDLLAPSQRWWVLAPFYAGALCFSGIALGIAIVLLGFVAAAAQF